MKNIKMVLKTLFVIAIIIPLCSMVLVRADSGWDSDYGGGSSFGGGGSSWSSSSSHSSGGGGNISDVGPAMAIFISLFISIHLFVFFQLPLAKILDKKNPKIKHAPILVLGRLVPLIALEIKYPILFLLDFFIVMIVIFTGMIALDKIASRLKIKLDSEKINENMRLYLFDENMESIGDKLFDVFTDVQMAWMNFEYDKLKQLCGDELATSYIQELEVLKTKHGQNIMSDFELKDLIITNVSEKSDGIMIEVLMTVSFYDYVIDTNTNRVTRGSDRRKITNNYKLVFLKGTSKKIKCPKCGGEFDANNKKCPYCRTIVNTIGTDYKLIQKSKV